MLRVNWLEQFRLRLHRRKSHSRKRIPSQSPSEVLEPRVLLSTDSVLPTDHPSQFVEHSYEAVNVLEHIPEPTIAGLGADLSAFTAEGLGTYSSTISGTVNVPAAYTYEPEIGTVASVDVSLSYSFSVNSVDPGNDTWSYWEDLDTDFLFTTTFTHSQSGDTAVLTQQGEYDFDYSGGSLASGHSYTADVKRGITSVHAGTMHVEDYDAEWLATGVGFHMLDVFDLTNTGSYDYYESHEQTTATPSGTGTSYAVQIDGFGSGNWAETRGGLWERWQSSGDVVAGVGITGYGTTEYDFASYLSQRASNYSYSFDYDLARTTAPQVTTGTQLTASSGSGDTSESGVTGYLFNSVYPLTENSDTGAGTSDPTVVATSSSGSSHYQDSSANSWHLTETKTLSTASSSVHSVSSETGSSNQTTTSGSGTETQIEEHGDVDNFDGYRKIDTDTFSWTQSDHSTYSYSSDTTTNYASDGTYLSISGSETNHDTGNGSSRRWGLFTWNDDYKSKSAEHEETYTDSGNDNYNYRPSDGEGYTYNHKTDTTYAPDGSQTILYDNDGSEYSNSQSDIWRVTSHYKKAGDPQVDGFESTDAGSIYSLTNVQTTLSYDDTYTTSIDTFGGATDTGITTQTTTEWGDTHEWGGGTWKTLATTPTAEYKEVATDSGS